MRVILDFPQELLERVFSCLDNRSSGGLQAFIQLALENQLALESETATALAESTQPKQLQSEPSRLEEFSRADSRDPPGRLRLSAHAADRASTLAPVAPEGRADIVDGKGDHWMWGQINRVLPLKFLVRSFVNVVEDAPLELPVVYERLSAPSREYALLLQHEDEKADRRREDRLSVGFPSGESEEAAVRRFLTQFFGELRGDGLASGALIFLGWLGIDDGGRVALTEQGIDFARLENPVLDRHDYSGDRLTADEREFYLRHCLDHAFGEANAFRVLLSALLGGAITNDEIAASIKESVAASWSDTMVSTQRSGTIGRMLELGLVERRREGVRVQFRPTRRGEEFWTSHGNGNLDTPLITSR